MDKHKFLPSPLACYWKIQQTVPIHLMGLPVCMGPKNQNIIYFKMVQRFLNFIKLFYFSLKILCIGARDMTASNSKIK